MPRAKCRIHSTERPCTCAMGNLYRFVEPVVLYLLSKHGPSYGYELANALQEHALTDSHIERAALYRTLQQLESNGYVTSAWDTSGPGPARHVYRVTPDGDEHLGEWRTVLSNLARSLNRFVEEAEVLDPAGDPVTLATKAICPVPCKG